VNPKHLLSGTQQQNMDDCSVSPLCNYNVVWAAYLDGNSFSGMLEGSVNYTTPTGAVVPLFFRGRHNIDAIVDAVSRNVMNATHLLKDAVNLVETGCSAGGLATYLHADYVRDLIPHSGAYYSLPISGYFLDYPSTYNGSFVYSEQVASIYAISNASTNAACQSAHAATGDAWRCNMAEYVYPFIESSVFVLNSKYDSWQTQCILTAMPVPEGSAQNGNCGSAPGWSACASDPTKCTGQQILHGYLPFGEYFTTSLSFVNAAKSSAPGNGAFIVSCHTHCEAQGGGFDSECRGGGGAPHALAAGAHTWQHTHSSFPLALLFFSLHSLLSLHYQWHYDEPGCEQLDAGQCWQPASASAGPHLL
jgi:STAM-binding protein